MCVLCCGVGCCWVVWYGVVVCVCVSESAWVWVCVFVCGVRAFKWLKNMLLVESAREKRRRKRSAMTRRLCCFCVSHAVAVLALKNINLVESAIKAAMKIVQEEDKLASAPPPAPLPQTRCLFVRALARPRARSPARPCAHSCKRVRACLCMCVRHTAKGGVTMLLCLRQALPTGIERGFTHVANAQGRCCAHQPGRGQAGPGHGQS